ncbi:MAG TPA: plastocyanin/azurin family copper-binding protein [Candidatus Paceibacterota bacterium]
MKKEYTIIIIAVVVVVVGWVFLSGMGLPLRTEQAIENEVPSVQNQNGGDMENGAPNIIVVSYNEMGFFPETVEVTQGETVVFVNLSNEPMWVASAIHPTHQLYPGFDSKGAVTLGERYEFAFDQKGTWKYHNHMRPGLTGTVIVK